MSRVKRMWRPMRGHYSASGARGRSRSASVSSRVAESCTRYDGAGEITLPVPELLPRDGAADRANQRAAGERRGKLHAEGRAAAATRARQRAAVTSDELEWLAYPADARL
jgi:hypothetical protein